MSEPTIEPLIFPRCPHCDQDLTAVAQFNWRTPGGGWIILCVRCPHDDCRAALHFAVVPEMAIAGESGKPIIDA
jgi:hypothetical protein